MNTSSLPFGCKVIEKSDRTVLILRPYLFHLTIFLLISVSIFLISLSAAYLKLAKEFSVAVCCLSVLCSMLAFLFLAGYYALGVIKIIITNEKLKITKSVPILGSNDSIEIADITKAQISTESSNQHYTSTQGHKITFYTLLLMGNFINYNRNRPQYDLEANSTEVQ